MKVEHDIIAAVQGQHICGRIDHRLLETGQQFGPGRRIVGFQVLVRFDGIPERQADGLGQPAQRVLVGRPHLGGRQPEAVGLYLATGYEPQFDPTLDPLVIGEHAFRKHLPAAG